MPIVSAGPRTPPAKPHENASSPSRGASARSASGRAAATAAAASAATSDFLTCPGKGVTGGQGARRGAPGGRADLDERDVCAARAADHLCRYHGRAAAAALRHSRLVGRADKAHLEARPRRGDVRCR